MSGLRKSLGSSQAYMTPRPHWCLIYVPVRAKLSAVSMRDTFIDWVSFQETVCLSLTRNNGGISCSLQNRYLRWNSQSNKRVIEVQKAEEYGFRKCQKLPTLDCQNYPWKTYWDPN